MVIDLTGRTAGDAFRNRLESDKLLCLIGVYDVFSARLAAERFEGVFCSGYSYAASAYGLPDIGYVNWRDITDFSTKIRHVLPSTHILVDVDDGFGDEIVASQTIRSLELNGLSAVMMEDQKRPRRCGHFEGKEILPPAEYLTKLKRVIAARKGIFVIARTDATDPAEALDRAASYADAGADGVMVEAIRDLETLAKLRSFVSVPIMVNQLHGGKSPNWRFDELEDAGASILICSTPCLFAAQYGIERYLDLMLEEQRLPSTHTSNMADCARVLNGGNGVPRQSGAGESPREVVAAKAS